MLQDAFDPFFCSFSYFEVFLFPVNPGFAMPRVSSVTQHEIAKLCQSQSTKIRLIQGYDCLSLDFNNQHSDFGDVARGSSWQLATNQ